MTNHIVDGRDSYMAQGIDENSATEKAISESGDATIIGSQFDRIHRPKSQRGMFAATAVLLILGLLVRLFIFNDGDRVGSLGVRLVWTGIGTLGMILAYYIDFTIIGKYPKAIYVGIMSFSAILVLIPQNIADGRMFYAQYAILLFPIAFSAIIYATKNKGYLGVILCGAAYVIPGIIALYIPFVSGFLHFAVVGAVLLGIAVYKKWFGKKRGYCFLLMTVPIVLCGVALFVNLASYGWARILAAVNPNSDGYWNVMIRELLSGAKLLGTGNIPSEYRVWLTEPDIQFYTDLLLTALISLVGWIAFAVIIGALLFFIVKGFSRCFKQKSSLGFFVSAAIMLMFSMQVISYIAFNFGFLFAVPISLPLISYGNTATVINLALIGFMLSVFRTGDVVTDGEVSSTSKHNRFISWADGNLTIYFKTQRG
jgi:cell division protein FtsW (lipid II flippase)